MDQARLQRIARQLLLTDRLLGATAVPFSPVAVEQVATREAPPAAATSRAPQRTSPPAARSAARSTATSPRSAASPPSSATPAAISRPRSTGSPDMPAPVAWPASEAENRSADERMRLLQLIDQDEVQRCTRCDLCESRTQTVFGEGNPQAKLMFIGEGPGQQEDLTGRPFVGPAGQLLDKMITAIGLSREEVYIANAVKCRPPNNRTPTPAETQTCDTYLRRQIQIVRPRAIVTLGGPATKLILHTMTGITALRGRWHSYTLVDDDGSEINIPVMPTFHPSFILRAYTKENRKMVWDDLQSVIAYLNQLG